MSTNYTQFLKKCSSCGGNTSRKYAAAHGGKCKQCAEPMRTLEQINADINAIFATYNIKPSIGEEAFWNAVKDIEKISKEDGKKLHLLSDEWKKAFDKEARVRERSQDAAERRNARIIDSGWQAYAREEGHYDQGD